MLDECFDYTAAGAEDPDRLVSGRVPGVWQFAAVAGQPEAGISTVPRLRQRQEARGATGRRVREYYTFVGPDSAAGIEKAAERE